MRIPFRRIGAVDQQSTCADVALADAHFRAAEQRGEEVRRVVFEKRSGRRADIAHGATGEGGAAEGGSHLRRAVDSRQRDEQFSASDEFDAGDQVRPEAPQTLIEPILKSWTCRGVLEGIGADGEIEGGHPEKGIANRRWFNQRCAGV